MVKLACPSCGAPLEFHSRFTLFSVCSFCGSMSVRQDFDLQNVGKTATLSEDMSPLQIGTRGLYEGVAFHLLGRLKIGWDNGAWNEWYAFFDDGRQGWLAEAQGFYMLLFAVEDEIRLPAESDIRLGAQVSIQGYLLEVDDIKHATLIGCEGELPMIARPGRTSKSVDLNGQDAVCATIDYSEDGTKFFMGRYVEFSELDLHNLREIDGW